MRLKAYICALHAALFAFLLAICPAPAGQMSLLGAGKASGGAASPAYTYLGNTSSNGLGPTTMTFPVTMPGAGGALVVYFAVQNALTISSVVYDPTGANVS